LGDDFLFGGVNREATATLSGLVTDVWAEEHLELRRGSWYFYPGAGLRYARYGRRAWTENGAGALSLSASDQATVSKQADVSLRLGRANGRFQPQATATYRRGLGDRQTTARLGLAGVADGLFVVHGPALARDALIGAAGLTLWTQNVGVSFSYEAQRTQGQIRQAMQLGVGF
jgi:outer membrane autotransporter protein